jgi:hypothetical protein
MQVLIEDETGDGYRIAGPRLYNQKLMLKCELAEHDAKYIRKYLDQAFPQNICGNSEIDK